MLLIILNLTLIVVSIMCFGGLMYTIHKFKQFTRESEEKACERNWRAFIAHYRPFDPRRSL